MDSGISQVLKRGMSGANTFLSERFENDTNPYPKYQISSSSNCQSPRLTAHDVYLP
jgi:hypothetical protein